MPACFYCHAPEKDCQPCPHCQLAWLCPESGHQLFHRPRGHDQCLPFRVQRLSEEIGRVLVATRPVRLGEVVLLDEARIMVPEDRPVCLGCLRDLPQVREEWIRCERCSLPVCSGRCQKAAWHADNECRVFAEAGLKMRVEDAAKPHFIYNCIGILRVILARERSEEDRELIDKLMSHADLRCQDSTNAEITRRLVGFFSKVCLLPHVSLAQVRQAFGVLNTNAMGLTFTPGGRALYPLLSLLSHSCVPNLEPLVQVGPMFGFRAQRDIAAGEQLTISYLPLVSHRLVLRERLEKEWLFQCTCPRCQDPQDLGTFLSSPRCMDCQRPGQGFLLPTGSDADSDWKCIGCGKLQSRGQILDLEEEAESKMGTLRDDLQKIVALEETFHPHYHHCIRLKYQYVTARGEEMGVSSSAEEMDTVMRFCREILDVLERLRQTYSRQKIKAILARVKIVRLCLLKKVKQGQTGDELDYKQEAAV